MSQSHVGENNPNAMMDVDTFATNNPPTQTNPTGTTAPSEAKKRKAMSSRSFVWDHYIKWDQETDEMREEGDEPLFEDECRCRCGKYPPVVKTTVPVDGRFEYIVIPCNTTKDHEIVWIEKEAQRALDVNEEASDKVLEVEQKYNEIRRPVYKKRNEVIQSIPNFWLTAATELRHPSGCAKVVEMTSDMGKWKHLIDKANTK